ncbi:MAG: MBL fold metallo-hydrolase [Treponema sp.]|jgi:competence protein ComEC|nr:MBL fold metallo-hydrolase [Treponema sp.]
MNKTFKVIAPPVIIMLIVIFGFGVTGCNQPDAGEINHRQPGNTEAGNQPQTETVNSAKLNIHFLELGNQYTGDSIYINYGDVDILIDAGSRQSSATTIRAYIDNHIKDNKLEYVIVTHAHQDHIAGFNNSSPITGLFAYEIGTIIDFPKTNSASATYNSYKSAIAAAVKMGAVHYTALQCFNNENGAQREYELGGGVKLEILYNYYYDHSQNNGENDYSVCLRIVQNGNQYIFTGDLEKDGEDRLVDYYAKNFGGLGHCVLYKAGHHASVTSSNTKLMSAITPEYVCVTACAGTSEYTTNNPVKFPSQDFVNRVAPYTDKVFVTTYAGNYPQFESFNGNIVFSVSDGKFDIQCSNNNLKLKETKWFKENRTMPVSWK